MQKGSMVERHQQSEVFVGEADFDWPRSVKYGYLDSYSAYRAEASRVAFRLTVH